MYTTQLTWFSPPHSPAGGFAPKHSRSPLLPLSLKNYNMRQVLLLYCIGVQPLTHHKSKIPTLCGRSYFYTAPCSQFHFELFTWIVSPATGIDLQPQT